MKKTAYPVKRSMNLYYKPDHTTKPATIALYVLFVLACLLGLGKFLVYDIWMETHQAQRALAVAEEQLSGVTLAQTVQIVKNLEASPIVAFTMVSTASTTREDGTPADDSAPSRPMC